MHFQHYLSAATTFILASHASATGSANETENTPMERRHIKMVTPSPLGFDNQEWGDLNPLASDGSNFPCRPRKGLKLKVKGSPISISIGTTNKVTFAGSAVHGGGSCQFALAEGVNPTKDTPFKVIKSIMGGCPKKNSGGNLPEGEKPDEYDFIIPDDFKPGDYTFAWVWINRIGGSPEYYMNCSPIKVSKAAGGGGGGPKTRRRRGVPQNPAAPKDTPTTQAKEALKQVAGQPTKGTAAGIYPDVFMANLGAVSGGCQTADALKLGQAILFPHPGAVVEYPNGKDKLFKQPCDGNPRNKNKGS